MPALIDNYATQAFRSDLTATAGWKFRKDNRSPPSLTVNYCLTEGDMLSNQHQASFSAMEALQDNWDGEGALAPDKSALHIAKNITNMLWRYGQPVFHVAPGPIGEVLVSLRKADKSLELLFYPHRWKYVQFSPHEKPEQGELQFSNFPQLLSWLNN